MLLGRIRADLRPPRRHAGRAAPPARDIAEGLRFVWSRPFFRVLMVWSPLVNLVVNALFFVAILRLVEAGFPPVQIGLVETAAGARRASSARWSRRLDHRAGPRPAG